MICIKRKLINKYIYLEKLSLNLLKFLFLLYRHRVGEGGAPVHLKAHRGPDHQLSTHDIEHVSNLPRIHKTQNSEVKSHIHSTVTTLT